MAVKCIITGAMRENTYIYIDDKTLEAVVIDPGDDGEEIINFIEENNINPTAILLTHAHSDHIESAIELKNKYNIPVMLHEDEEQILENPKYNLSVYFSKQAISLKPDKSFSDNDIYSFANKELKAISTPGHTPGGVCYYSQTDKLLFTGDTLFYLSIGRTDFELGSHQDILKSIKEKLFYLPNDTIVYPGHGMRTTIKCEKENNPFLK